MKTQTQQLESNPTTFAWSNRNFADGWWKVFYYCHGTGFDAGRKIYYGRNDFGSEGDAIGAQREWERRF